MMEEQSLKTQSGDVHFPVVDQLQNSVKYNNAEDFVSQQLKFLMLEREAEVAESQQLLDNVSAKKLQEKGVCLISLALSGMHSGLYGRTILSFCTKTGDLLPATSLSSGNHSFA